MPIETILVVVLILILIGALPVWPYSSRWGYYPSGVMLLIVVLLLAFFLFPVPVRSEENPPDRLRGAEISLATVGQPPKPPQRPRFRPASTTTRRHS